MLPAIVAGVGLAIQAAGFIGESSAAEDEYKAQVKNDKLQTKISKKNNKLYQKQAELAARGAKEAAMIKSAAGAQANALRKQFVDQANAVREQIVAAQNTQADASKASEEARFKQMSLDSTRRRRDIIRNAIYARGQALAGASYSGAIGGSGIQGGLAQIRSEETQQTVGEFQNFAIGNSIFQANQAYTDAGSLVNQYQASLATLQSQGEYEIANLQATTEGRLALTEADYADRNTKLTKQLYSLQDRSDKIQSKTNIKIGAARTDQATYQGISRLGGALTGAGNTLFG